MDSSFEPLRFDLSLPRSAICHLLMCLVNNAHGYVPVYMLADDMIAIRNDVLESHGFEEPDWLHVYPGPNFSLYGDQNQSFNSDEWMEV